MTNSLVNHVLGSATKGQPVPEVGMGATELLWTDRHAVTIVFVGKDAKTIKIQEDNAKRVDSNGQSECQEWEFSPNTDAPVITYTLRKNGSYVRKGDPMVRGQKIRIGAREHYYDFSF